MILQQIHLMKSTLELISYDDDDDDDNNYRYNDDLLPLIIILIRFYFPSLTLR